ncbi:MAG: cytidine deaminase [Candidatus Marinimicrobia bacterium]|nr:cytidine deaminase [Candidatus Neomarinimicrobiota bacterium]|tara:strand:- start:5367 stop:5741 length:375 start_codon:yes stop_codon:yes gene_type:complete
MLAKDLIKHAVDAQNNAQAKYSKFYVGCAILSNDDKVFLGCNIESAAYPSTMCAERVAIYSAIAQGVTSFKAIAIVSKLSAKPCGPCRQIIHEYLGDIPIYVSNGQDEDYETHSIKDLLPYPFG